jgi:hypothetical protein
LTIPAASHREARSLHGEEVPRFSGTLVESTE